MTDNLKLLMAEDNDINRKLADLLFKRHNLQLDFAVDGHEALEMAAENNYDLIFMDIEMPGLNGIEATQEIKAKLGDKAPPIVALTAHAMDGQKEEFIEKGLDDYLSKPIKFDRVEELFSRLIKT